MTRRNQRRSSRSRSSPSTRGPITGSAWSLRDDAFDRALVSGEFARELEDYFGPEEYAELRQLAQEAQRRGRRGGPAVLILPGIMGSKLGERRKFLGLFPTDDLLWLDPLDVVLGKLPRLALSKGRRIEAVGVFWLAYAKLRLRLRAAGFEAEFQPFDWRRSIAELGRELAERVKKIGVPVSLVAHSMGGLVSRAAIRSGAKVQRLIQLGSPNFGSYAPLCALRGVDDSVKKIAALDLAHDRCELINQVFRGFPGLLELLPSLPNDPGNAFFQPENWPTDARKKESERMLAPEASLLRACARIQDFLAPYKDPTETPWTLIAGVNQETVTQASFDPAKDELTFEQTFEGDGTVPLRFARVPGLPTLYVEESHGQLANHPTVARAVVDLLDHGSTDELPAELPTLRRARGGRVSESELRQRDPFAGVAAAESRRGRPQGVRGSLRAADVRSVLAGFVAPGTNAKSGVSAVAEGARADAAVAVAEVPWKRVVVGRARQHRLDLQIGNCSITQVSARAYVLGLFREVAPSGAARVIDDALDGAVTEFTRRRMFSGAVGGVFMLPANRSRLRADMVLFAGLGYFDQFNDEVQRITAENVIRTLVRTRVEDLATVLLGGGTGMELGRSLANLIQGFVCGKLDADVDHHFRRVTLCETDPARYQELRRELYRLVGTSLFEDVEVTLTELPPLEPELAPVEALGERARAARAAGGDPVYLIVRRERETSDELVFGSSVLTAGAKAAVLTASKSVPAVELRQRLAETGKNSFNEDKGRGLGEFLAHSVLADSVRQVLASAPKAPLVVVHDGPASRLPWETLRIDSWEPALAGGLSRRYMAENLSVAKYLEQRDLGAKLRVLLVINPTADLDGAEDEGERVREILAKRTDTEVKVLAEGQATRRALLAEFASGRHDLVHYAGHAFFDPDVNSRSGLVCHGREVLSGTDLGTLGNLPRLVFFNACESGRTRWMQVPDRRSAKKAPEAKPGERVAPAEAFLRGGIANFIGTYWPVGDDSAEEFSATFYEAFLTGESIGEALLAARKAVKKLRSVDWSDYIHYGDFRSELRS
jgi:pimeloyl-ACP methyl ester carboxylesterase